MFVSRQRNFTLNTNEFNQGKQKNINNFKDVNMKSDNITLEESQMKVTKSLMYISNCMNFEN